MTGKIMGAVAIGLLAGFFLLPHSWISHTSPLLDIGLCALLFFVGMDIGRNKDVFRQLKEAGILSLGIPLSVALGSITGAALLGVLWNYTWNQGAAVGAGLAWYTLSPLLIAPYSSELSAIAFLANVSRELLAVVCVPLVAKYLGPISAIAPPGAAGMDTLLPIVSKATDPRTTILCFISGFLLSLAVPILVPFFIAL